MKKYVPYAVLALLVLAGVYFLMTGGPVVAPQAESLTEEQEATSTPSVEEAAPVSQASSPGGISLPEGLQIVKQTAWATFNDAAWDFSFKYQSTWGLSTGKGGDEAINQANLTTGEGTILITREVPIAQPALLKYETSMRTVAGQEVEVREYVKPKDKYAYYLYATLSDGNDLYFISIKSYVESKEWAEDFLDRVAAK
jgi:hypothetical protein